MFVSTWSNNNNNKNPIQLRHFFPHFMRTSRCLLQKLFTFLRITQCNARCGHLKVIIRERKPCVFLLFPPLSWACVTFKTTFSFWLSVRLAALCAAWAHQSIVSASDPVERALQPSVTALLGINTTNECMTEYASE